MSTLVTSTQQVGKFLDEENNFTIQSDGEGSLVTYRGSHDGLKTEVMKIDEDGVLCGDKSFTIIYPNGGSAASPATINLSSRYFTPNPFPGHMVVTRCEVLYNGEWVTAEPLAQGSIAAGVSCGQIGENIVVTTSSNYFVYNYGGYINSNAANAASYNAAIQCRIKVWKVIKEV